MKRARWVLALAAVIILWGLGGHDLWAPDEPYFAEGAREMLADGQWAVPHVNGVVTTDKPPLFFWLIALLSAPFGAVLPLTARLPSALAALGTVALTLRLGGRIAEPRTAAMSGALLATSTMFWMKARSSQTDALLCCLVWVALSAFEAHRAGGARGRAAGALFWTASALAVLTKGPVGLLLPLGAALVTLALDRDLGRWKGFAPWLGPALFAAIVGAWMLVATLGGGGDYSVWGALKEHFIARGLHGMHHRQPPWYFLEVLPIQLLPWSGLLPGALVLAWRRRDSGDRFLLAAALFVVLFFSISTEKRELYVLPAFPALAVMMARLVGSVRGWEAEAGAAPGPRLSRRWLTVGHGVGGALMTLAAIALPIAARRIDAGPYWVALVVAVALFSSGVATLGFTLADRPLRAVVATAVGISATLLVIASLLYPALESTKSARPFALRMKDVTASSRAAGEPVLAYGLSNLPEAFAYYSDGVYTVETNEATDLERHLSRDRSVFAVVDARRLSVLPEDLLATVVVIERARLSRREVLLISNRTHPAGTPYLSGSR